MPHITPNCRSVFFPLTSLLLLHDKGEDSASSPHLPLFFSLFLLSLFLLCHHKLHSIPYIHLLLIFLPSPCISVPLLQSHNLHPGPHPHTGLLPLSPPLWLLIQDPGRSLFSSGPSRVARVHVPFSLQDLSQIKGYWVWWSFWSTGFIEFRI